MVDIKKLLILVSIIVIVGFIIIRKMYISVSTENMENIRKDMNTLKQEYEEKKQEEKMNERLPKHFTEDRELPNLKKSNEELNKVEMLNWTEFLDTPKGGWWVPETNKGVREVSKGIFPY